MKNPEFQKQMRSMMDNPTMKAQLAEVIIVCTHTLHNTLPREDPSSAHTRVQMGLKLPARSGQEYYPRLVLT